MTWLIKMVACAFLQMFIPNISEVLVDSLLSRELSLANVLDLTFIAGDDVADVFLLASVVLIQFNYTV